MDYDRNLIKEIMSLVPQSKFLHLIFDEKGAILDIINSDAAAFQLMADELKRTGSLTPFFDLTRIQNSADQAVPVVDLPGSRLPSTNFQLYTTLPRHSLVSRRIGKGLFLGRITHFEFQPMVSSQSFHTYLFTEQASDTLVGFTQDFHGLFKASHPDPSDLLGKPVSEFLVPSPAEFQRAMIPRVDPAQPEGYEPFYSRDFTQEGMTDQEEALPLPLACDASGWRWTNADRGQTFLTVLKSIDVRNTDFIVTLVFENQGFRPPYLTLGGRYAGDEELPDNLGYLAGLSSFGNDHYTVQIKRNGFSMVSAPGGAASAGELIFHFCKAGRSLHFFDGAQRRAACFDPDFMPVQGNISLGLRKGGSCVLKRLEIRIRPARGGNEGSGRHIVRVTGRGGRTFTLDRFYNNALTQPQFLANAGYFLNDVTPMQERIQDLSRKVDVQVRREQELKSRLRTYERGERPMVADSGVMRAIRETAELAAASDATVLIEGPTGSGKEVMARFIHERSRRKEGPFVKVDCATVPATLLESHLFGHEKGAFTGALARSTGMLESADKGTLFLDEAGNLTPEAQVKLLQFLNDFTVTRVGGTKAMRLDVRVVTASNVSLEELVRAGRFRQDLYYRLHVVYLKLPPLRERREDLLPLARHFLERFALEQGKSIRGFSRTAEKKLLDHKWPGNIRELSNVVQRAVIFCAAEEAGPELVRFLGVGEGPGGKEASARAPFLVSRTPVKTVVDALKKHHGRANAAAKELGMGRATLYKFLKANKVDPDRFRRGFPGGKG